MIERAHILLTTWHTCLRDAPVPFAADASPFDKIVALDKWLRDGPTTATFQMLWLLLSMLGVELDAELAWFKAWASPADGQPSAPVLYKKLHTLFLASIDRRHVELGIKPKRKLKPKPTGTLPKPLTPATTTKDVVIMYAANVLRIRALATIISGNVGIHVAIKNITNNQIVSTILKDADVVLAFPEDVDPTDPEWKDACAKLAASAWKIVAPINSHEYGFGIVVRVDDGVVLENNVFYMFAMSTTMANVKKVVIHIIHDIAHTVDYCPQTNFKLTEADIEHIREVCVKQWPHLKSAVRTVCHCGLDLNALDHKSLADDKYAICGAWPIHMCHVTKTYDDARDPVFTQSTLRNVLTPNLIVDAFEAWHAANKANPPSLSDVFFAGSRHQDKCPKMHPALM
jgi:hypothetical protein